MERKNTHSGKISNSSLTFRFNAQDEELEELFPDNSESTTEESTAASTPTDSEHRDSSPFRKIGRRSTSVDSNNMMDASTVDHPWSFFHGIREMIEDKMDEIKKERQQKINEKRLSSSKQHEGELIKHEEAKDGETNEDKVEPKEDKKKKEEKIVVGEANDKVDKDKKKQQPPHKDPDKKEKDQNINKVKSKFADLKRKFKPDSEDKVETELLIRGITPVSDDGAEDIDVVEIAEEADEERTRIVDGEDVTTQNDIRQKLLFSAIPRTSCRTPGLVETFSTACFENFKIILLLLSVAGLYCSVYPIAVGIMLGAVFAMEIQSILDWVKETFFVWTDSNSEYLITTNPYHMSKAEPIFDKKSLKTLQPHKIEYVGWVNEFKYDYSPEKYHLSLTETVYIQLQGSLLRISEPRIKIPKRAVWNEPQLKLLFNVARLYNICNCQIVLLPKGIIRQRIWNRKYPICIILKNDSHVGIKFRNKTQPSITEEECWLPMEIPDAVQNPSVQTSTEPNPNQKIKSKSTESFLTLHDNLKINLEKSKEESELKAKKTKEDYDLKSNVPPTPVRRKKLLKTKDSEIQEEYCDNTEEMNATLKGEENFSEETPLEENHSKSNISKEDQHFQEETLSDVDLEDVDGDDDSVAAKLDFQMIKKDDSKVQCIYLFARTDRDKELWYRRLKAATSYYSVQTENGAKTQHFVVQTDSQIKAQEQNDAYIKMMSHLNQKQIPVLPHTSKETIMPRSVTDLKDEGELSEQLMWINALLGRTLFDVFRNQHLRNQIQSKLQRKLNAIRVPRFLGQLNISKLEFSNNSPVITQASKPRHDENGIWFELDVVFEGVFRIQIDTKLILMNLKKPTNTKEFNMLDCDNNSIPSSPTKEQPSKLAALHSDIEDSGETSSDNDEKRLKILADQNVSAELLNSESSAGLTPNRMLRMVDRITNTKMFDKLTDNAYVKKLMEDVANKDISLFVELQGLAGRVVINIPPPPSDRLWYGFKGNPRLWLTAYPKFGDTEFSLIHISNILQKMLCTEFQKVVVLPNMDDFLLDGLVEDSLS